MRNGSDDVEHRSQLSRLVEVQTIAHDDVEHIFGQQTAVAVRLNVVGRVVTQRGSQRRPVRSGIEVIRSVGEELEHERGEGRATLPQVDFERLWAVAGSVMASLILSVNRGRRRIFSLSGSGDPSLQDSSASRLRAWCVGIPGRRWRW